MKVSPAPTTLGVSLKLYFDIAATAEWAQAVAKIANEHPGVQAGRVRIFVLPSLPAVPLAQQALGGSGVQVGAQDLHWEDRGAFTGAVSGADLYEVGCRLVEVGHAERRQLFGEDEATVRAKLAAAVRNRLVPVLCIGEPEHVSPRVAAEVCVNQLDSALAGIAGHPPGTELIVAYEPVWAIGRSEPAAPDHVRYVAAALRSYLGEQTWLASSAVIYGGSAQRGSLTVLGPSVDGLFLGRFAHDPAELAAIIDEASNLS
jgi:triosephosphate isomerase